MKLKYKMPFSTVILVLTATCTGLMAGLFYAYSCSVVPGLGSLTNREYIAGMQAINKAIQNPVFFACFFGTLLLLPVSTYLNYNPLPSLRFWLLLAATIVYFTGVFGVTALGNIPLNNSLEKFNLLTASAEEVGLKRMMFEKTWNTLNIVRTLSSTLSLILVIIACINSNKN